MTFIEKDNRRRYLQAPTIEQIDEFVAICKVSYYRFEDFYGMPKGTIKVVKTGYMAMPVKFWHIFYEKIIPTYGVGVSTPTKVPYIKPALKKKSIHVVPHVSSDDRLSAFR